MRSSKYSPSRGNRNLIIFTEPPGMIEPRKGALNKPALREFLPLMRLYFLRNINIETKLLFRIRNKSTSISSVCTELLDRRVTFIRVFYSRYPSFCVMNICGVNHRIQRIHYDVPISAFRLFRCLFLTLRWLPLSCFGNQ